MASRFNGHEFEQTPGDSEGQGRLTCCSPWGLRVGHNLAAEQLPQEQTQSSVIYPCSCFVWESS